MPISRVARFVLINFDGGKYAHTYIRAVVNNNEPEWKKYTRAIKNNNKRNYLLLQRESNNNKLRTLPNFTGGR